MQIKNQFFYYTRQSELASFNMEMVTQTLEREPGKLIVALNDFHEQIHPVEVMNAKRKVEIQNRKVTVVTEIQLNEADTIRYKEMVGVSFPVATPVPVKSEPSPEVVL